MSEWTRAQVEERLEEAAWVMRRLPPVKVQGYFNAWPEHRHSFGDKVGQEEGRTRAPAPSPQAISRAEATLLWLRWLELEDARLIWERAQGTRWKPICWRFGISRATAHRRWEYGLSVIVWRLNGKRPHLRRGKRHVVARAR